MMVSGHFKQNNCLLMNTILSRRDVSAARQEGLPASQVPGHWVQSLNGVTMQSFLQGS